MGLLNKTRLKFQAASIGITSEASSVKVIGEGFRRHDGFEVLIVIVNITIMFLSLHLNSAGIAESLFLNKRCNW